VCEQGARLRNLDLETAAVDAAHWWRTGQIPLRPTPVTEECPDVPLQVDMGGNHAAGNLGYKICYFCGLHPADDSAAAQIPMHGNVWRQYAETRKLDDSGYWIIDDRGEYETEQVLRNVTWDHTLVPVPRCRECRRNEGMMRAWCAGSALAGSLLGALGFCVGVIAGIVLLMVGMATGGVLGHIIGRCKVPYEMKTSNDFDHLRQYPKIKELLAEGWDFGEKPF